MESVRADVSEKKEVGLQRMELNWGEDAQVAQKSLRGHSYLSPSYEKDQRNKRKKGTEKDKMVDTVKDKDNQKIGGRNQEQRKRKGSD